MSEQSRESETKFIAIEKDIEHIEYIINELKDECEFVKEHFTKKNGERIDDVKLLHGRIEQHQQTDLEFHENVRKKISERFDTLDSRIRLLERWKWIIWGGLIVVGTLIGYFIPGAKVTGPSLL